MKTTKDVIEIAEEMARNTNTKETDLRLAINWLAQELKRILPRYEKVCKEFCVLKGQCAQSEHPLCEHEIAYVKHISIKDWSILGGPKTNE